jgi:hypothetical protein
MTRGSQAWPGRTDPLKVGRVVLKHVVALVILGHEGLTRKLDVDEELALIPYKMQCYARRRALNESHEVIYIANTFW